MPEAPPRAAFGEEIHLPTRPAFGRMERSRYRWMADRLETPLSGWFTRRLEATCRRLKATALHSIPHGLDFIHGYRVARRLGLKFFFNVHDDVLDTVARYHGSGVLSAMIEIWRGADARFVISEQLGREYCQRYGDRPFEVVTDGLETFVDPRPRAVSKLRIYFMGLFHLRYEPNLESLLRAMEIVRAEQPALQITATFRCGSVRQSVLPDGDGFRVLPFGTEADVEADMREADLLYLPLPFGDEDESFVRYSLSTKMITYLGSGLPILYHGPRKAAASELLSASDAAFVTNDLEPEAVAAVLRSAIADPAGAMARVERALRLARTRFALESQRGQFWNTIEGGDRCA